MRILAVTVYAFLVACSSSKKSKSETAVELTHTVNDRHIHPASSRRMNFVPHSNFVQLTVTPKSSESSEHVPGWLVSWHPPISNELVNATSAHPAIFTASIPYSQKANGRLLLGTDSTTYHPPAYLIRSRKIQVEFTYDIDESQLPLSGKLGLPPLYRSSLSATLPSTLP